MRKHTHIDGGMIYVDRENRERDRQDWKERMESYYCRDRHNTTCLHRHRWRHHTSIYSTLHVLYIDVLFILCCILPWTLLLSWPSGHHVFDNSCLLSKCHRQAEGSSKWHQINNHSCWKAHLEYCSKSHVIGNVKLRCQNTWPLHKSRVPSWLVSQDIQACCLFSFWYCLFLSLNVVMLICMCLFFCFGLFQRCFRHWLDSCTNYFLVLPKPGAWSCGHAGVGKSSWVNAVRRVSSPNDPDFAELCVDGPTMEPQMYRFPAQNLVKSMRLHVLVAAGSFTEVTPCPFKLFLEQLITGTSQTYKPENQCWFS